MSNATAATGDEEQTAHPAQEFDLGHVRHGIEGIRCGEARVIVQDRKIERFEN